MARAALLMVISSFFNLAACLPKSGIITNTFQALEPFAIKAISDGSYVECKLGLDGWKKNLDAAVKRFKLAGASKADISLVLKNQFSNGDGVEGDGKKVQNLGSDVHVEANKDNEILLGKLLLHHGCVGGFVTHCRCNSVLKAVTYGEPMAVWPLYAEQAVNGVFLVEEMKLEIPVESKEGFVSAEEVEKKVSLLMDGKSLRLAST